MADKRDTIYLGFFLFHLAMGALIASDHTRAWCLPVGLIMMAYSAGYVAWSLSRTGAA